MQLEKLTYVFRLKLASGHVQRIRDARSEYDRALEAWAETLRQDERDAIYTDLHDALADATSSRRWHEGRAKGQCERFERVTHCGSRSMIARCRACGEDRKPIAEGCGVRRVCQRCDVNGAVKRRARFGRARGRTLIEASRYGLTRRVRKGGRYTEKMLTLTLPHASVSECRGLVAAERPRDTLHARVIALWLAWPRFWRNVKRHLAERNESWTTYHRSFEWTPASDGQGHPHFHVYLWCPFVDASLVRAWWGEALRAVGWPVERDAMGCPIVRVDLKMLRGFDLNAIRELMKGGRRSALTLSKVETLGPGLDAFDYAEGWTLSDVEALCSVETQARLYMALEGRRLTQASRGFFEADEPPACECCGNYGNAFVVRFRAVDDTTMWTRQAPPDHPPN